MESVYPPKADTFSRGRSQRFMLSPRDILFHSSSAVFAVKPLSRLLFSAAVGGIGLPMALNAQLSTYDQGNPTVYEQLMLELVNRARADPPAEAARFGIGLNDGLTPGTITTNAKPPLAFHPMLISASRAHSDWMLTNNIFDHIGAGGSEPDDRMIAAGYTFTGTWTWGENIAWGGTTGVLDMNQQTIARHESLFRSSGHRRNICVAVFRDVGIGVRSGTFDGYNAAMVTQKFALSGSQPHVLVTGVVYRDTDGNGFYSVGEGLAGVTVVPEGGTWKAITSASGGYAVPYTGTSGNLNVVFSGGPLARTEQRQIVRSGINVKLDMVPSPYVEIVPGSLTYAAGTGFSLTVRGTSGLAFRLQYSEALSGWTDVATRTMGATPITLSHNGGLPKGFYRLAW